MMRINFQIKGLDEFKRKLEDLKTNQMPYALARACTKTAQDIQTEVINRLPSQFKLRTGWYKPNSPLGFRVTIATKQNLQATVGTSAWFMDLQETGGLRVPFNGKTYLCVPTENVKRTASGLIREDMRPIYLLKGYSIQGSNRRKGVGRRAMFTGIEAFIGVVKNVLGIWLRGPGHNDIRLMYVLVEHVKINPRLHFIETAKRAVKDNWQQNASEAIAEAIRTAR